MIIQVIQVSDDSDANYTVPIAALCPAQHGGEAANLCRTNTLTLWQSYISECYQKTSGRYSHPLDSDSEGSFWYYRSSTFYIFRNLYSFLIAPRFLRFLERKLAPDSGQHGGNCQEKACDTARLGVPRSGHIRPLPTQLGSTPFRVTKSVLPCAL